MVGSFIVIDEGISGGIGRRCAYIVSGLCVWWGLILKKQGDIFTFKLGMWVGFGMVKK